MAKGRIELDPEQIEAVNRMVNEPTRAALNASQYGTGKTVVTVEVGQQVAGAYGVKIIVAPLHTKYSWKSTILRQYPDENVQFVNSLKSGKAALEDLLSLKAGWYIFGREFFQTKRIQDQLVKVIEKVDYLAYDECQRWANHKSQGFKAMKRMKAKYRMALSATPGANKFSGLYAITQWLWPKFEGHQSFWTWAYQWGEVVTDYYSTGVTGEKVPGAFVASLPCYIRLEKDFGDPIEDRIEVMLSNTERKIYNQIEKTMIAWFGDNPMVITMPIVKRIRLRQASLGELSFDPETDAVGFPLDMKSSKYDALLGFINEHDDEPMLILTESAKYANIVAARLMLDGKRAVSWTGEVSERERHKIMEAFVETKEVDYIVATIASIGEGVDGLQHRAHIMVWLSRSDNMMLNEQAFRRLHRRGQTKTVISMDIVAIDTYDDGQLSKLVQQAINMNRSLKK